MRLVDATLRLTKKVKNENNGGVVSFFNRLIDIFFLHCPECGGKIESIGQHNGSTVYECTVCHKEWI